jgi:twitching motility protein PilT
MIRDNKNHQIDNAIASGSREGMISMDQAILQLYREGKISRETAEHYSEKPELLKRQIQ